MVRASTRLAAVGMRLGGVRDLRQPHHRVALTDRQVDEKRRHLADRLPRPGRVEVRVRIDRHRRHRPHGRRRRHRLATRHQPVAQRPGNHGQHNVVDVAVVARPHQAVVLQPMARHGESAVARHSRVQRAARRGAAREGARDVDEPAPDLDQLTRVRRHLGHRRAHGPELLGRTGDPLTDGAEQEPTVARLTRRDPDVLTELRRLLGAVGDRRGRSRAPSCRSPAPGATWCRWRCGYGPGPRSDTSPTAAGTCPAAASRAGR